MNTRASLIVAAAAAMFAGAVLGAGYEYARLSITAHLDPTAGRGRP